MSSPAELNNVSNVDVIDENKAIKKHKRKSKKRKKSDPAVANISLLLSGRLNLVSPETKLPESGVRQTSLLQDMRNSSEKNQIKNDINPSSSKVNDKNVQSPSADFHQNTPNEEVCSEVEPVNENGCKLQSKNVFEFMMDNRNKSIGRNSPGKEREVDTNLVSHENKEKLMARKVLFEKWAVLKGSKKHKAEEKEREVYVNRKLAKRKRKLKKMLSLSGTATVIVSDTENSQDTGINEEENRKLVENKEEKRIIISDDDEERSDNRSKLREDEVKSNSNNNKKNETNFRKSLEAKNSKNNISSQTNSLDNFLGISSPKAIKRKFTEDDDDDFEVEEDLKEAKDDLIKIKMFSPKVFKRRKKVFIANNTEDFQSKGKKGESFALKKKGKENNVTKKLSLHLKNTNDEDVDSNDDIGCIGKELYNPDISNADIEVIETEKLSVKQPKTLKSNRKDRRSKLLEEHKTFNVSSTDDSSNDSVSLINNDSENYPRRSLRTRKTRNQTYKETIVSYLDYEDSSDKKKNKTGSAINNKPIKLAPIFLQTKSKVKLDPSVLEARKQFLMSGIPDALKRTIEKQQRFALSFALTHSKY